MENYEEERNGIMGKKKIEAYRWDWETEIGTLEMES